MAFQGSILGHLLFALYVNVPLSLVSSKLLMFADDIKLYHTIYSPEDCSILQRDINVLLEWSKYWLLSFNLEVVHIGRAPYFGKLVNLFFGQAYAFNCFLQYNKQ